MLNIVLRIVCWIYILSSGSFGAVGLFVAFSDIASSTNSKGEKYCKKNIFICFFKNYFSPWGSGASEYEKVEFLECLVLVLFGIIAILILI